MNFDNTNSGALYKNDRRKTDKHPEYQGMINIEGVEYWISGWVREAQRGKRAGQKFFSLSAKQKEPKPENAEPPVNHPDADNKDNEDDDIPF